MMTQEELRAKYLQEQERMGRDLASGVYKGDLYANGKPLHQSAHETTYALMKRLAELDAEVECTESIK